MYVDLAFQHDLYHNVFEFRTNETSNPLLVNSELIDFLPLNYGENFAVNKTKIYEGL